jgi:hypothetical protein
MKEITLFGFEGAGGAQHTLFRLAERRGYRAEARIQGELVFLKDAS